MLSPRDWLLVNGYSQWRDGCWNYQGYEIDNPCSLMQEYADYIVGFMKAQQ